MEMKLDKSTFLTTEFWIQLVVLLAGMFATLVGLPEELAGELEGSLTGTVVSVGGLIAVASAVYSFLAGKQKMKTEGAFLPGWTDASGLKTSEFYVALLGSVVGLLTLFGIVNQEAVPELNSQLAVMVEALFSILAIVGSMAKYMNVRSAVKVTVSKRSI